MQDSIPFFAVGHSSIFAFGHQVAIPFAEPDLGLPAESLNSFGQLFEA